MNTSTILASPDLAPLRVLILPANTRVAEELLEQEADVTRIVLDETRVRSVVRAYGVRTQSDLREQYTDFLPDIVQFTGHGTPGGYVVLDDVKGALRILTGRIIARLMFGAERAVRFFFFNSCRLYGPAPILDFVEGGLVTLYSPHAAVDVSRQGASAFYAALASSGHDSNDIVRLNSELVRRVRGNSEIYTRVLAGRRKEPDQPATSEEIDSESRSLPPGPVHEGVFEFRFDERPPANRSRDPDAGLGRKISADSGARVYRIWYGTNRCREALIPNGPHYGSDRDSKTNYGYCDVVIPKYHVIGSVGSSWWERFPTIWRGDRLSIQSIAELSLIHFRSQIRALFDSLSSVERVLLLFIHGFNVTFADAAIRTAQLGFDLGVPGTTAMFSWPSKGTIKGYPADEASIEASEVALRDFILEMATASGATRIHIIAHSMGNRALLRVFSSLTQPLKTSLISVCDQIFLAAPDVDVDVFKALAVAYEHLSKRTTMYSSARDRALWSSGLVHDYPRAGYTPPVTVVQGLDTIEVTNIDLTFLGHGYVAEARTVLSDIHALMQSNVAPDNRFGLDKVSQGSGIIFWRIRS